MSKSVLFASAAVVALSASVAMANGASERAIHNLRTAGQAPAHQNIVAPGKRALKSDFAVVNADGSLARGRNVASVEHLAGGVYIVHFTRDKTGCAFNATVGLGGSSGTSPPGYATVVGAAVDPNGVFMDTYNSAGSNADLGFHLVTTC
jgi:hypothetical protein